ncbi:inositol polyphosphate multikinase [Xylariomycetidae sp. FL0641]|nr:inositol polyphosphate multikinase [Xylariomycetidae sp. FL0641]
MSASPAETMGKGSASSVRDREIPERKDLVEYNYAVAGHDGTMCDADGELFIKPCTKAEVDFYESAHSLHTDFADWMPLYIGTLSLTEDTDDAAIHAQIPDLVEHADIPSPIRREIQSHLHLDERPTLPATTPEKEKASKDPKWAPNRTRKITTDRALVLENASYGYKKPNIMDAKLGLRLWADDAPPEKKNRFNRIAAETTHAKYGFRVAGMRVWKGSSDESELDYEGYRIYDKDWGRFSVNNENLVDSLKKFIFNEAAGIDENLGKTIAGLFATDLRRVQAVLEAEESRMYSSSLLFVFEGDGDALRSAIAEMKTGMSASGSERGTPQVVCANHRVDSGIGMDDDVLSMMVDPEADLEGSEDEDEESSLPHLYSLRLIDFAHATWRPGEGPDENVLLGVRSLAELFEEMAQ